MACAWKLPHIGERLTGGAGETQEQDSAPREAGHWMHRPRGERIGRDALAPAYVWRGSDTDESSHPKALDL